jgi:hypothetical protein
VASKKAAQLFLNRELQSRVHQVWNRYPVMSMGVRVILPPIHTRHRECHTRLAQSRFCGVDTKPQVGPVCSGGRRPPLGRRLDIAAAAVMERGRNEHSAVNPRPDSVLDIARSNPADGVGMEVVQGSVMEE